MSPITTAARALTARERAILTAVAAGRAEMTCSCEPDLFVDGLCCCDQATAHELAHIGLITTATAGDPHTRRPAVLTPAGATALASNLHSPEAALS